MWICSKLGFFSIVKKLGGWHVRGRCRQDIERLAAAAGIKRGIGNSLTADYAWRFVVNKRELGHVFRALEASVDYGNFKGAIACEDSQRDKLGIYHEWWENMADYQQRKGG
jgi:hypothetical protein